MGLRRNLDEDVSNPTSIFTEPRVGYRMPKGEEPEGAKGRDRGEDEAMPA